MTSEDTQAKKQQHTSLRTHPQLFRHIQIPLLHRPPTPLHLEHHLRITLPGTPAKRARHLATRLGLCPHLKALLVYVLSARSATPHDRLGALSIKRTKADRTIILNGLALTTGGVQGGGVIARVRRCGEDFA